MGSEHLRSPEDSSCVGRTESGRESVVAVAAEVVEGWKQTRKDGHGKSKLQSYWDVVAERGPRLKKSVDCTAADVMHWVNRGSRWRAFLILSTGAIAFTGLVGILLFFLFFTAAVVSTVIAALLGSIALVGTMAALFFFVVTGAYLVALATAGFMTSIVVFCMVVTALFVSGWIAFWWVMLVAFKKVIEVAHGVLNFAASRVGNVSSASRRARVSAASGIQKKSE